MIFRRYVSHEEVEAKMTHNTKFIDEREEKFGSAPIYFVDESKQKEWDAMEPDIKDGIRKHLHSMCRKVGHELSIELLCHLYNELSARMDRLEASKDFAVDEKRAED